MKTITCDQCDRTFRDSFTGWIRVDRVPPHSKTSQVVDLCSWECVDRYAMERLDQKDSLSYSFAQINPALRAT